ncbi:heavy metal-associated isoprenylated plant protein 37-like [Mangifera indica]|uniref:heavy metal-associated isoprenylated plant protein 37-like n=1 Tax=Mangifera indica TaxID=29780 RepID=UPI001CF9501B|nr:heavy metal-associated isoprenylated plant protein 37-like [Mangifera indica]
MVMVSGRVDSATLIRKLVRSGKHAELWLPKSYQKLNQGKSNMGRDEKGIIDGHNGFEFETRKMYPSFLGNDLQDNWHLDNYLNPNIEIKGGIDHSQMAVAKVEDTYMRNGLAMENQMNRSIMAPALFSGNENHDFRGFQELSARPVYGYEQLPSMATNSIQTHYYFNHSSPQTMDVDNSMMANPNYMPQPQMMNYRSSFIPHYDDFGLGSSPFSYY